MTLSLVALIVGFVVLIKGADVFVDDASKLAVRLGIPPLLVGLVIVALGTSAPEAAVSISSSFQSADQITIANVFGSNTMNTLVVLGITALVAEVPIGRSAHRVDIPFVVLITGLLLLLCQFDGKLGRIDCLALLALLVAYMVYLVHSTITEQDDDDTLSVADDSLEDERSSVKLLLGCVLSAAAIAAGSQMAVWGATELAHLLGMSERVVGLTVVAYGTSLPELTTSIIAARKGQTDLAVGNVVGSSILNILFVLGVSGMIAPIPFAHELLYDGLVALAATVLVWVLSVRDKKLSRRGALALLGSYAAYLVLVLV